ncbi:MAG: molybdenum cofactor guanylyltransferase, partial [Actinobacteria bacterium]|nr:molybdenum cofactor guanylyltransferase [Actinomycetota bacterium]
MSGKSQGTSGEIAGAILVGGLSSRMGQPKHLLQVQGTSLLELLVDRFRRYFGEVLVVGSSVDLSADLSSDLNATVVQDRFPGRGPLAGVQAALAAARAGAVLAVGCDMPLATPEMAGFLDAQGADADVVVPVYRGKPEPLHALYRRSCLSVMERVLSGPSWSIL